MKCKVFKAGVIIFSVLMVSPAVAASGLKAVHPQAISLPAIEDKDHDNTASEKIVLDNNFSPDSGIPGERDLNVDEIGRSDIEQLEMLKILIPGHFN